MNPNQSNTPDPNSFFQPSSAAGPTPPPTPPADPLSSGPSPTPSVNPLPVVPAGPTLPSPLPPAAPSVPSWFASPDPNQPVAPQPPVGFDAPNFPQPNFPQPTVPMQPLPRTAGNKGQQLAIGLLVLIVLVAAAIGGTILLNKHHTKNPASHGSAGTNNPLPPADLAANKTISNITVDPSATTDYKVDSTVSADDAAAGVEGSLTYIKLNANFLGTDVGYSWVDNIAAAKAEKDSSNQLTAQQKQALKKLAKETNTTSSAAPDIQFKDAAGNSYPLKCTKSSSHFDKIYSVHYSCAAEFNHSRQGLAFIVSSEDNLASAAASEASAALQLFTNATTLVF